ncbi:endoplasmic reticulum-Golgi intermediate compartment protein 1-like [Lingula anatina]|uniref:Endoplasmic reticulum-Golgi intermediate compartment protein 1-like n=1 Tax=Lingula anatina TaxID=7574 RepID=A0A1S3HCM5_LINAN|nr:endoplasmic reticulum-Golgi intermediate compartment protein 1-like [Lingula anatina]XP_013420512.1 endoplasmic reticulum-Golgi intermediate compartment protein 1-like [Lingula anatina]|eukprot:XP_013383276.1 endoplasmic reticulum-Golgi intermediate compartment protein 1-like [Lingula anatina]
MQFDIRRFDIYRKIPKDLTQPTQTGAVISILSTLFISYLFLSELLDYISVDIVSEMFVDDPTTDRIPVKIDLSIPHLPCQFIGLDIQDDLGRHEVGFVEDTDKTPINEMRGCRFKASFNINKVPGNFHISTHASQVQPDSPNMNHIIHSLVFGDTKGKHSHLPGSFNPLKDVEKQDANPLSSHDYFLKIVPSIFETVGGKISYPYQYTYAYRDYLQYGHGHRVLPAIWFRIDLSPITVKYTEKRKPFYSFLTMICAILGGTFTVAGIIDSLIFTAAEIFKKAELGKLS